VPGDSDVHMGQEGVNISVLKVKHMLCVLCGLKSSAHSVQGGTFP
jgi:hypothetical protein